MVRPGSRHKTIIVVGRHLASLVLVSVALRLSQKSEQTRNTKPRRGCPLAASALDLVKDYLSLSNVSYGVVRLTLRDRGSQSRYVVGVPDHA
jgi:hypothetical protein